MKKIKTAVALLLTTAISLSFYACGGVKGLDATIYYSIMSEPRCLDPQIVSENSEEIAVASCFEGLVRLGENGAIVPGVAESWSISKDECVYTFKLRENAKWHLIKNFADILGEDYKETFDQSVTAEDFAFALRRAVSPETGSPWAESLFSIRSASEIYNGGASPMTLGVTAPDRNTLIIQLTAPNAEFLETLTTAVCMPCNKTFFEATKGRYGLDVTYLMCNGPFYLSKWVEGSSLLLRKNADYFDVKKVLPSAVSLNINKDYNSVIQKISDGSYSGAMIPYSKKDVIETVKSVNVEKYQSATWSLMFNCGDEILGNENIRKALCSTVSREQLSADISYEFADGIVPDCCTLGEDNYRALAGAAPLMAYNESYAMKFWTEGVTELDKSKIDITVKCTAEFDLPVRRQVQIWQRLFGNYLSIGIEVTEAEKLESDIKNGDYRLAFGACRTATSFTTKFLHSFVTDKKENVYGFASEEYDLMIKNMYSSDNEGKIVDSCKNAERYLLERGVVYPVFKGYDLFVSPKNVYGIFVYPAGENVSFIDGRVE
ncbi:MAG: peptide ABC transporter substrate-binding protein [Clostridiales bacterium]|nr:peptide ABC transporter substrate-binding protein [Clostridiales bacterium]